MTLPSEEANALKQTRVFLADLVQSGYRPGWTELRQRASVLLKHYPYYGRIDEVYQPREQTILWKVWAVVTAGVLVGLATGWR